MALLRTLLSEGQRPMLDGQLGGHNSDLPLSVDGIVIVGVTDGEAPDYSAIPVPKRHSSRTVR